MGLLRDCKLSLWVTYSKTFFRVTITSFGADSALCHMCSCIFSFDKAFLGLLYEENESLIIRVSSNSGLVIVFVVMGS